MREAIGGSVILNIALVFIVLINGYLAVSVQYTKAFRVKNQIVSYIEQYEGFSDLAEDRIADYIGRVMYDPGIAVTCPPVAGEGGSVNVPTNPSTYCVVRMPGPGIGAGNASVYRVTTFLTIQLPFVGNLMETVTGLPGIPIRGETKLVFSNP